VAAAVLGVLGIGLSALQYRVLTTLPADAREARWALEWRRALPDGAVVAYVERSGTYIFTLPLYERATRARAFPIRLGDGPLPRLGKIPGPLYYYRSSVCSTPAAGGRCDELERSASLELVTERELPAPASLYPYATPSVSVRLLRRR
jgi:hypothetical protein